MEFNFRSIILTKCREKVIRVTRIDATCRLARLWHTA